MDKIHNHEVPSSILGPATKKHLQRFYCLQVFFFLYRFAIILTPLIYIINF